MMNPVLIAAILANVCANLDSSGQLWTAEEICEGQTTKLATMNQLINIQLPKDSKVLARGKCHGKDAALRDMRYIAERNRDGHLCWQGSVGPFAKMRTPSNEIPVLMSRGLHSFSKALGFAVSGVCKLNLLSWINQVKSFIDKKDFDPFIRLEQANAVLLTDDIQLKSADMITLTSALFESITRARVKLEDLDEVPLVNMKFFEQVHQTCQDIFDEANSFMANVVIGLVDINRDYPADGPITQSVTNELRSGPELRRWLNILLTCSAVSDIDTFEPDSVDKQAKEQRQKKFKSVTFQSVAIENVVPVDQEKVSQLRSSVDEAKREAEKWRSRIYSRIIEHAKTLSDRFVKSDRKFWRSYVEYMDHRIGST